VDQDEKTVVEEGGQNSAAPKNGKYPTQTGRLTNLKQKKLVGEPKV